MGPGSGGNPYVRSVAFRRGYLEVGIRRELAQFPQRLHLLAIHSRDGPETIHEQIGLDTDEKTVTVRFEPTTDDTLIFEPIVPLSETVPERDVELPADALPIRIVFRAVNAKRPSKEFDAVTATLEADNESPSVTDLTDGNQIGTGGNR